MNKNGMNRFRLIGLLSVVLLSFSIASASYMPSFLPESSLWQGSRFYNENGVNAYVEYAVYDSWADSYHNAFNPANHIIDEFIKPGTGEYIYAYEVKNLGQGLAPIAFFQLIGGNPSQASGIGSQRDGSGVDIVPTNNGTSSDGTTFMWKFNNGIFIANKNSAFMVFSSDKGPVAGSFRMATQDLEEGGDPPPINGTTTPEPATLAMLAAGGVSLLTRRRSK